MPPVPRVCLYWCLRRFKQRRHVLLGLFLLPGACPAVSVPAPPAQRVAQRAPLAPLVPRLLRLRRNPRPLQHTLHPKDGFRTPAEAEDVRLAQRYQGTAEPSLLRTTWRETPRPAPWPATGRAALHHGPAQHCRRAQAAAYLMGAGLAAAGLPLLAAPGRGRVRAPKRAAPSAGAAASGPATWKAEQRHRTWSVARRLLRRWQPCPGEVAGTWLARRELARRQRRGRGHCGRRSYGLARGTGWVLENTLFRLQQGSENAAVQDVRSANMNDATSLSTSRCK